MRRREWGRKHPKKGYFSEDGNGQEKRIGIDHGDDISFLFQRAELRGKGKDDCGELSLVVFKFPALEYVTKVNVLVAKGIDLS